VRPTVAAWRADTLNVLLAKQTANELNNMAERIFHHWCAGAAQVYFAQTPGEYRRKLVAHACSDFQLVWDIADAHKHVALDQKHRIVSRDEQTAQGSLGWGERGFGEGAFGGADELVVRLDDGSKRAVSAVIENVLAMWELVAQP